MDRSLAVTLLGLISLSFAMAQQDKPATTLRLDSKAVLIDVIVSDASGQPVTGLSKDAFTVTEEGKPQTISYFEENGTRPIKPVEIPKLPPNVFSNFSPFPQPPAVNVLLLDSLNTPMTNQLFMHKQVKKFLENTKPGSRSAIFTMSFRLRMIQGFTDDPAVLEAALENKKNIEVEQAVMLKSQAELSAQSGLIGMMSQVVDGHGSTAASPGMISALQDFLSENDASISCNRMSMTVANLQRLAEFLQSVPGRKNIIWFAQKVPASFSVEGEKLQLCNPAIADQLKKTLAMLANERAAIYPVDPRGLNVGLTENVDSPMDRNSDQLNAQLIAEQTGGQSFANTNGIAEVVQKVTSNSGHFYSLSYTPKKTKMDGEWRKIGVKVTGGKYNLSYRRGYFAVDTATRINNAKEKQSQGAQNTPADKAEPLDALLPQMILGTPQMQQILYKIRITPVIAEKNGSGEKQHQDSYRLDFAVNRDDLKLSRDAPGSRKGALLVSLIVFDRYGNIVSQEDHAAPLNMTPEEYATCQNTGVQMHADLSVPKGNYWLRTGIFDPASHKIGTMEIPLGAVQLSETPSK